MRPNKLRELLKANKPTLSTHIHTTWPSVVEAIGHTGLYDYVEFVVFETAIKMGVPPRAEIATADQAKYFLDMGVRHFSVGTDITILHQWWKSQGEDLRKALGH